MCGALTPWLWWHSGLGEAPLALLALQLAPASACCNRGGSEGSAPVGNSSLAPQEPCQSVDEGVGGQGPSPQQPAAVCIGPPGEARRIESLFLLILLECVLGEHVGYNTRSD